MIGKSNSKNSSPIVDAIATAQSGTTGEIRVHLSKGAFGRDPYRRALRIFNQFKLFHTRYRNAVLIYVNLRQRQFAIVGDVGIHQAVGQYFWNDIAKNLQQNLRATHQERAISLTVLEIGEALKKHFPLQNHP